MGSGASTLRGVEAYIFINNSGNGNEVEQWWMDQGYLVQASENESPMEDIESLDESSEGTEDTQENMLRHEVPYYNREEIEEFFPPAPTRPNAFPPFPPNISTDDAENMSISIADADAIWTEWWNSRDANIEIIGVPSLRICYRRCRRRREPTRSETSTPMSRVDPEGREFMDWIASDVESTDPPQAPQQTSMAAHPIIDEMSDDIEHRLYDTDSDSH